MLKIRKLSRQEEMLPQMTGVRDPGHIKNRAGADMQFLPGFLFYIIYPFMCSCIYLLCCEDVRSSRVRSMSMALPSRSTVNFRVSPTS